MRLGIFRHVQMLSIHIFVLEILYLSNSIDTILNIYFIDVLDFVSEGKKEHREQKH